MSESSDVIRRLTKSGYKVRTKEQWGSKQLPIYAKRLRSKPVDFPVSYGFVHITVTRTHGDAGMRQLEEIGTNRFGSGVSYNWVVDHQSDHTIYVGQPLGSKGTHTVNDKRVSGFPYDLNYAGHAVAFMGDVDDPVCDECVDTIAAIFAAEKLEDTMRRGKNIFPHRKFAAKSCPGDKLNGRMDDIERAVEKKVADGDLRLHKPTRVEQARELLEKAKKLTKSPARKKKIQAGLNELPKE